MGLLGVLPLLLVLLLQLFLLIGSHIFWIDLNRWFTATITREDRVDRGLRRGYQGLGEKDIFWLEVCVYDSTVPM